MAYVLEHFEFFWIFITGLLSFSFGCGITYFTIKETRRNVNGLGGKVTKIKEGLILYLPEEVREKFAEYIK